MTPSTQPPNEHGYLYTPIKLPVTTDADRDAMWELMTRYPGNQEPDLLTFGADCVALGRALAFTTLDPSEIRS